MSLFASIPAWVRGGGDLGSGVAYRLHQAGFPILITELPQPLHVRREVCYGSAVIQVEKTIEGITARRAETVEEARDLQSHGHIAVMVDPDGKDIPAYHPVVLVDARMTKRPPDPLPFDIPLIVGLGPGFEAPANCHALIETMRGHYLGRVIRAGTAIPNTGIPGAMKGKSTSRVLRAPVDGFVLAFEPIGAMVTAGQPIAEVGGEIIEAPFDGVLRGLVHQGLHVPAGMKIGDVDPRAEVAHCFTISDKSLAIGGGVLEAILSAPQITDRLATQ